MRWHEGTAQGNQCKLCPTFPYHTCSHPSSWAGEPWTCAHHCFSGCHFWGWKDDSYDLRDDPAGLEDPFWAHAPYKRSSAALQEGNNLAKGNEEQKRWGVWPSQGTTVRTTKIAGPLRDLTTLLWKRCHYSLRVKSPLEATQHRRPWKIPCQIH